MIISVREFQLRARQYLDKVDKEEIILTVYNLPVAKIVSVNTSAKSVNTSAKEVENSVNTKCEMPYCKSAAVSDVKVKRYNQETGNEIEVELSLCRSHLNKART